MKAEYKKGEVWLCSYGHTLTPIEINEISGKFIRHKFGWEEVELWHERAKHKLGTARYFLGIRIGIK